VTHSTRILVVDDEEAGRFVKVQTLRRAGFTVSEAATGNAALGLVESEAPDLVVLDVNLPDISGLEVTRRIRARETGPPTLQILQISNTAVSPADRVAGLEHGADVYLVEPVEGDVLVATVQSLLRVRRAEAALAAALEGERHARELAEQANRLKDEFIATLSHELRTPLNALMGWIWQLRNATLSPASESRALDSIERNARMQAQLINDLLDVSRASRGKLQLVMRVVELNAVVAAAIESVAESIAQKGIRLDSKLSPVYVAGDEARLQQVVTNLLTNAVQFTPNGGRISVTLSAENDDAVIGVEDTGAGIDPAFLPHVFEQFRQGEGGLSRKHGGLGLGLAVVKQLVELHSGTASVTSQGVGRGATFAIRLPRASRPEEQRASHLLLEDLRILIVTNAGNDSAALRDMLESSGARVSVETLQPESAIPSTAPDCDLIISDLEGGVLACRVPDGSAAESSWQAIPRSSTPADVVRRIARMSTFAGAS
jgi:signal transduction histidine kinase